MLLSKSNKTDHIAATVRLQGPHSFLFLPASKDGSFLYNTRFSSYNGSKFSSLFMLKKQQNGPRTRNRPASRPTLILS